MPAQFKKQNGIRNLLCICTEEEKAAIVKQSCIQVAIGEEIHICPDRFVYVIGYTLGVTDRADNVGSCESVDESVFTGSGIGAFTAQTRCEGEMPIVTVKVNGVIAPDVVGDIGIKTHRIFCG